MNVKFLILLSFVILYIFTIPIQAQVTIGSGNEPVQAAILDIKTKKPGSDEEAADGGVLMPRVALANLNSLHPLLDMGPANDNKEKLLHVGLVVYNVGGTVSPHAAGIYYWTGSNWKLLMAGEVAISDPWYKVGTSASSRLNTDNSYLNAKAVINGALVNTINTDEKAVLTVIGADASINGLTLGKGKGNINGNTSLGLKALQSTTKGNNTAIGSNALTANTLGENNTAVGYTSLSNITTGGKNTAIGSGAGSNITTGQNNLMIGSGTQAPTAASNNHINVGNALFGIQGATISAGRVGVGIAVPQETLHVNGSMSLAKADYVDGDVLVVDSNGKVGIRETAPVQYVYMQSVQETIYSGNELNKLNNADDVVLTWLTGDLHYNNDVVELISPSVLKVKRSFAAEVSGYINYRSGANYQSHFGSSNNDYSFLREHGSALLNLKIQISTDNGANWADLSNTRGVWTYSELGNQAQTVETPVVIKNIYAGNQIRMVIQRPILSDKTIIGLPHGQASSSSAGIVLPSGMKYSKGIRIVGI